MLLTKIETHNRLNGYRFSAFEFGGIALLCGVLLGRRLVATRSRGYWYRPELPAGGENGSLLVGPPRLGDWSPQPS